MKLLLILLLLIPSLCIANVHELKICLTGSTEKALPKYGEAFVNGAKMAIGELSEVNKKKSKLEVHYYESNPLAPISKLQEMRNSSCDAIIGFSTGNDLISIEESLKENPVLTLSIYGDPQDRFEETSYLRTMQPSAKVLVEFLFSELPLKIRKDSNVLIVTAGDRSEMLSYKEAFLNVLKEKTNLITQVTVIEQTHDLRKFDEKLKESGPWDYVVLLTRSLVAAELTDKLYLTSKPIILGTKYFGSSELPAFYNFLKNKKVIAFFARQNCSCDMSKDYQKLIVRYKQLFGIDPMSISLDSYDATKFILQSIKSPKMDSESVIRYLNSEIANYDGPTSLKISKGLKLSTNKRFLMKVDESGYKVVK